MSALTPHLIARIRREVARVAPAHDVDDLAQEACARVIEKEHLWRSTRGRMTTWAAALARNVARNRRRRQAREAEAVPELAERRRREDDRFSANRIRCVLEQFARLPQDERRLLRWRYLEERGVTDIARELGISQPAATRRIQQALATLQQRARRAGLSAPLAGFVHVLGAHKMKIAAASLVVLIAAATPRSWFLPDPDASVVAHTRTLPATTFAVSPQVALAPDDDVIWCATAPLFWREIVRLGGGPVTLDRDPAEAALLNASPFSPDDVSSEAYVADAGLIGGGVVDRIQKELQRKFGRGPDPRVTRAAALLGPEALFAYAFLFKQMKWPVEFEKLRIPLGFLSRKDGEAVRTEVRVFGFEEFRPGSSRHHLMLRKQVTVFEGRDDAFAVELRGSVGTDRVLLAAIPPGETLAATIDAALALARKGGTTLRDGDSLMVPVMDFDLTHDYGDLHGRVTAPAKLAGRSIGGVMQTVRFRLDHAGVTLKSAMMMLGATPNPPPPRALVFDRPLLVLMQEKGRRPYLAMWVATPEILVKAR